MGDFVVERDRGNTARSRRTFGSYPHQRHLLSSRFRYPHRRVYFGKVRFYGDRIELSGWHFRGRHRRCIPLAQVSFLEYHTLHQGANLTLFLENDRVISLHIREAYQWGELFEHWMPCDIRSKSQAFQKVDEVATLVG